MSISLNKFSSLPNAILLFDHSKKHLSCSKNWVPLLHTHAQTHTHANVSTHTCTHTHKCINPHTHPHTQILYISRLNFFIFSGKNNFYLRQTTHGQLGITVEVTQGRSSLFHKLKILQKKGKDSEVVTKNENVRKQIERERERERKCCRLWWGEGDGMLRKEGKLPWITFPLTQIQSNGVQGHKFILWW